MSTFLALNIEPEEDVEEEIDDTKEIQIEESLKLYQNALKLHSQGPDFYDEAAEAYILLFKSEIFAYPESLSEARREALCGPLYLDEVDVDDSLLNPAVANPASYDGAPSTLPQILYLSYKNHGQFLLDRLTHQVELSRQNINHNGDCIPNEDPHKPSVDISSVARDSLSLFADALERDDTDSDLWRRTSKIANLLGSYRIARYSLEAILDGDADQVYGWPESLGLEELVAKDELRDILRALKDGLSEHELDAHMVQSKVPAALRKVMDTILRLPKPVQESAARTLEQIRRGFTGKRQQVVVPVRSWASVGQSILQQANVESQGIIDLGFGSSYSFITPETSKVIVKAIPNHSRRKSSSLSKQLSSTSDQFAPGSALGEESQRTHDSRAVCAVGDPSAQNATEDDKNPLSIADPEAVSPKESEMVHVRGSITVAEPTSALDRQDNSLPIQGSLNESVEVVGATILPTRKRSSDSAGFQEPVDSGRVRSKRIRARADPSTDEEAPAADLARYFESQLQAYIEVDQPLFKVTGELLTRIDSSALGSLETITPLFLVPSNANADCKSLLNENDTALQDFKTALGTWDFEMSHLLLHGDGLGDQMIESAEGRSSGLTMFLEYSKRGSQKTSLRPALANDDGLGNFVDNINRSWQCLDQIAVQWIIKLLGCRDGGLDSTYICTLWPDALKQTVVQVLVQLDAKIYAELQCLADRVSQQPNPSVDELSQNTMELAQAVFELHLDIYGSITNPSSEVDQSTRTLQLERSARWAALVCRLSSHIFPPGIDVHSEDVLVIRHLWSLVVYVHLIEVSSRDHVLLCLKDLKVILQSAGNPTIELPNNAIMPEISVEAAEREVSRISSMDLFLEIFNTESNDPLTIIETLEPILWQADSPTDPATSGQQLGNNANTISMSYDEAECTGFQGPSGAEAEAQGNKTQQMVEYISKANISLRLFMWRKLRTAYERISYPPMVFLCLMKSIDLIMKECQSQGYLEESPANRIRIILRSLRFLFDLVAKAVTHAIKVPSSALEFMDENHLRSSIEAVARLVRLLHVFVMWEDTIRIGQSTAPGQPSGHASTAYLASINKIREMQIKAWTLHYVLLQEAMSQKAELFPEPDDDLASYLRVIHHALGSRQSCGLWNNVFLRFLKAELLRMKRSDRWEFDMAQVIFDLHGLKICPSHTNLQDHGCNPEPIDRVGAIQVMDIVIRQAHQTNTKDLLKSDLRSTIDKMQQTIGAPKQSVTQLFNKRKISAYFKSPINPIDMYRSLQGIGDVCGISVTGELAEVANKGWYYLLGHMTLLRFRSQKRTSPGPTDDLDIAMTFLKQDLEFGTEKWETWYRLAQVYDTKIEEDTTWAADKLNNQKNELNNLQRCAIHCYKMATAVATRCADESFDTASKLSDLFTDFGMRVYTSSREPYSMEVFSLSGHLKLYSGETQGMYEGRPFRDLKLYPAWKFASVLFQRALIDKPGRWINWYMLGKCLWKMYKCAHLKPSREASVDFREALDAFIQAIECMPERRDSRHTEKDPTLEPHYKLVSIIHKLVQMRRLQPAEGCQALDATRYACKISHVQDLEGWKNYILQVLKALRAADKVNWHHRMVARAAHVIYDDSPDDVVAAAGAKQEFTQQVFTKTMAIQVWKPENERAGRHFVYTSRYVRFFVRLLYQLNDRASLEALARRIRKKAGDFLNHSQIWEELCTAYVNLLRHQGSIPDSQEDLALKSLPYDAFAHRTSLLEAWAHNPATSSPILNLLRETIELKKLNNSLMKNSLIDDLINDVYALLHETVVPELVVKSNDAENRDRMRVDHLLMSTDSAATDAASALPVVSSSEQPASRARPKTVSRREIQRKAEAVASRPVSTPSVVKGQIAAKVQTPVLPQAQDQEGVPGPIQHLETSPDNPALLAIRAETGREGGSSVAGSVHDSADGESELSEFSETEEGAGEEATKPMFPNLTAGNRGGGVDEDDDDEESKSHAADELEKEEKGDGPEKADGRDDRVNAAEEENVTIRVGGVGGSIGTPQP